MWYLKKAIEIIEELNIPEEHDIYVDEWVDLKAKVYGLCNFAQTYGYDDSPHLRRSPMSVERVKAIKLLKKEWRREDEVKNALHFALTVMDSYPQPRRGHGRSERGAARSTDVGGTLNRNLTVPTIEVTMVDVSDNGINAGGLSPPSSPLSELARTPSLSPEHLREFMARTAQ